MRLKEYLLKPQSSMRRRVQVEGREYITMKIVIRYYLTSNEVSHGLENIFVVSCVCNPLTGGALVMKQAIFTSKVNIR